MIFLFLSFVPEMARSIFLRAPKVVMPSSFRSWSVRVRNVCRSIWKQQQQQYKWTPHTVWLEKSHKFNEEANVRHAKLSRIGHRWTFRRCKDALLKMTGDWRRPPL